MNPESYIGLPGNIKQMVRKNLKHIEVKDDIIEQSLKKHIESPQDIISLCCVHFNISWNQLTGHSRKKDIVKVRHLCMYVIILYFPKQSLVSIGKLFDGRDHASIIHARDAVQGYIDFDKEYRKFYNDFTKTL